MSVLRDVSIFSGLSPTEVEAVEALVVTRTYPKHTVIMSEGDWADSLYVVIEGKVKVFVSDSGGKEFILNTLGTGSYFGELALLDGERRSASVMTLEKSQFGVITKDHFAEVLDRYPAIARVLIRNLVSRIREFMDSVKTLALQDVYGRIRHTLLNMAAEEKGLLKVSERLTQQDIANRVGSSREMVARVLKDLTIGGYINVERKQITILKELPEHY